MSMTLTGKNNTETPKSMLFYYGHHTSNILFMEIMVILFYWDGNISYLSNCKC